MTSNVQQAGVWHRHRLDDIGAIRAAMLDLIDVGPADSPTRSRPPTRWEKDATYRVPGPDGMFDPTPRTQSRRTGRSDPTGRAALRFEAEVQEATTRLAAVVSGLASLVPDLDPPDELETRTTLSGRTVVDADAAMCRIHVLETAAWLEGVVAGVAQGWREGWAGDAVLRDRVEQVEGLLAGLRRRLVPERPRLCACGCRRLAPPVGEGATRSGCRSRLQRERESA